MENHDPKYAFETRELKSLFETVRLFVAGSCGDGDGWIIAENYGELADLFETYEKERDSKFKFLNRYNRDGRIMFGPDDSFQESINFVNKEYVLPKWAGDIVVQSSHFFKTKDK